jgi:hypothetical protein
LTTPPGDPIDFSDAAPAAEAPRCVGCNTPLTDTYWAINSQVVCDSCRSQAEHAAQHGTRSGGFGRALLFGIGGMLAGALVWYAVAKIANLEIGLIAILLGYLVGRGVHKGAGNRGGLKFQLLAVFLTYLGIGMAYVPFVIEAVVAEAKGNTSASTGDTTLGFTQAPTPGSAMAATGSPADSELARLDSLIQAAESNTADSAASQPVTARGMIVGIGALLVGILSLPVLVVMGDFPGSIISIIIYAIAFMQAWKLTQGVQLEVSGPFKVGTPATS